MPDGLVATRPTFCGGGVPDGLIFSRPEFIGCGVLDDSVSGRSNDQRSASQVSPCENNI